MITDLTNLLNLTTNNKDKEDNTNPITTTDLSKIKISETITETETTKDLTSNKVSEDSTWPKKKNKKKNKNKNKKIKNKTNTLLWSLKKFKLKSMLMILLKLF